VLLDTNVIVRHLTGDPPADARRATAALAAADRLVVTDVVFAETVFVLESFYEAPRESVATRMRSLLAMPSVVVLDRDLLLRALELYEVDRLDFAEAHLVATAEATGVGAVLSFDRDLRRARTVTWARP
jgi:predicted nucleic-acid-binding protein